LRVEERLEAEFWGERGGRGRVGGEGEKRERERSREEEDRNE